MSEAPAIQFTDPCLGSVGSQPFLDDVEAQLNENRNAQREGRNAQILPIKCRLCNEHHEANQLDTASVFKGTEFEEYAYDRIAPRPDSRVYIPNDVLRTAHMAVNGGHDPFPEEVEEVSDDNTPTD